MKYFLSLHILKVIQRRRDSHQNRESITTTQTLAEEEKNMPLVITW